MTVLAYHLPTYSPLSLDGLLSATGSLLRRDGEATAQLESFLRERYDADRAVLLGSGAQALQRALEVGLVERAPEPGRRVVALPAFTCFEVASAAVGAGARVVLYDVDPATLAPDLDSFRRALEKGAAVAVVTPLFGIPVEWTDLEEAAHAAGAFLVEDAAQGDGAAWGGRRLGSLGAVSVLSFGRGKGWSGIGGGALLLRGAGGSAVDSPAPGHGREVRIALEGLAQWALGRPALYRLPRSLPFLGLGQTVYSEPAAPRGITTLSAALLMRSHAAAEREAEDRRENARSYLEALPEQPLVQRVAVAAAATPGYLRLPIRTRFGLAGFSRRPTALGVEASYPKPLSELPAIRSRLVNTHDRWPGAEELAQRLVTLPTHSRLRPSERRRVVELVRNYGR
jgi:perosamine synthetase